MSCGFEEDKEGPKMQEESESQPFPLDQDQLDYFLKVRLRSKPVKVHLFINKL